MNLRELEEDTARARSSPWKPRGGRAGLGPGRCSGGEAGRTRSEGVPFHPLGRPPQTPPTVSPLRQKAEPKQAPEKLVSTQETCKG